MEKIQPKGSRCLSDPFLRRLVKERTAALILITGNRLHNVIRAIPFKKAHKKKIYSRQKTVSLKAPGCADSGGRTIRRITAVKCVFTAILGQDLMIGAELYRDFTTCCQARRAPETAGPNQRAVASRMVKRCGGLPLFLKLRT